MMTFDEMWSYSNQVYGSFTEGEARAMYDVVSKLPFNSVVVEIGSYCGRSSSLLGQLAHEPEKNFDFTCIDNFITAYEGQDVESIFRQNMPKDRVKYQLLSMSSRRALNFFDNYTVDALFIDGDHTYEGVRQDIELWDQKVKIGGYIFFHDYNSSWEGVKRAVDEKYGSMKISVADSMAYIEV